DGHGGTSTATATIAVDAVADTPTITATASAVGGSVGGGGGGGGGGEPVNDFTAYDGSDAKSFFGSALVGTNAGIEILSAAYTGADGAASKFDGVNFGSIGSHTFALGQGILLTSGDGTPELVDGPSDASQDWDGAGDPALDALAGAQTKDAS